MKKLNMFGVSKLLPIATVLLAGLFSTSAQATYHYWLDVGAEAGTYSPIALGDNLELDACGSSVHHYLFYYDNSRPQFGLCDLADLTDFTLTWTAEFSGNIVTLGTYSGAAAINGLNPSFTTGAGTFFNAVGNYVLGLYLDIPDGNASINLPDGYTGSGGSDAGYISGQSYQRNADYNETSISITAASVPEPAAALLLLPALLMIARRQRKLSKMSASPI